LESYSFVQTKNSAIVQTIERASDALWLGANSFVQTIRGSFVQQIEPAKDAVRMEEGVELFSTAFEQVCALKVIDKLGANSLTQKLTAAEITAVFRGQGLGRAAQSEPQPGVHL
jgi:hypothetical protein